MVNLLKSKNGPFQQPGVSLYGNLYQIGPAGETKNAKKLKLKIGILVDSKMSKMHFELFQNAIRTRFWLHRNWHPDWSACGSSGRTTNAPGKVGACCQAALPTCPGWIAFATILWSQDFFSQLRKKALQKLSANRGEQYDSAHSTPMLRTAIILIKFKPLHAWASPALGIQ